MQAETILQLKKISSPKQFAAREYVCSEGQPGSEMYIILKGSVGIFITSVIGTLTQVATIKVGDFFGEMAIFDNLPRSASCIALEDTMAVAITKDNLQELMVIKYLQAININEHINPGANALIGSLWRNLYWLSKDASDTDFAMYCAKKTVEKYKLAVDQDEFPDKASKAAIALSLANLLVYCGERKDLKNYIAIATESPDDRIRNRALQIMAKLERMQNK